MIERAAQAELLLCLVAVACLLAAGVLVIVRREHGIRNAAAMVIATLAIAALRGAVTRFSIVHANFHAVETLDEVYAQPLRSTRGYGVFNSLFYGGVMRLAGADFTAVAWTNEILAAATLLLMGFLGGRYASSRSAFVLVIGLGLMHPMLLRLAGSEEGHNLAVLLSFVALAAAEAYRTTPLRAYLVIIAAALVLMVTKGIMLASVPCIAAIGLVRAHARQRRALLASMCAVMPMILVRLPDWGQQEGTYRIGDRLSLDSAMVALHTHPVLDPRGPVWLIAPLLVAGMAILLARSWGTRIVVAALALLFASSFLLFEGQAVVFTFRLPVLTMAIIVAGIGAATIVDHARARWPGRLLTNWGAPVAACVLVALTVVAPGFDVVRVASPQTQEYDFIRSVTGLLPRSFTLVRLPVGAPLPSYVFPHHLLERAGIAAPIATYPSALQAADTGQPLVFLAGLECWGYSALEVQSPPERPTWRDVTYGPTYGEFPRIPGAVIPARTRTECERIRQKATRVVAARDIVTPSHADAPFIYYGAGTTPLELLTTP